MQNRHLRELFRQYLERSITPEGESELFAFLSSEDGRIQVPDFVQYAYDNSPLDRGLDMASAERIFREIVGPGKPKRVLWKRAAAVAAVTVAALFCAYFITTSVDRDPSGGNAIVSDILPGSYNATLTTPDGTRIALDAVNTGEVVREDGALALNNGRMLTYELSGDPDLSAKHTLSTPKGGQYQMTLPDGSLVWLNAASSITFPKGFASDQRRVEITGEVYFEIAGQIDSKGSRVPFVVALPGGSQVDVLGTKFNVNSYVDEPSQTATLVEGSVRITAANGTSFAVLSPGTQGSIFKTGGIVVVDADVKEITSWKEGNFIFNKADIHTIMRQLARWYNIEVEYPREFSHYFVGTISREVPLAKALETLQLTGGVRFEVDGQRVTVLPGDAR